MPERRITHVAIRREGKVYSLPAPNRHHHIPWCLAKARGHSDAPEVKDADKLAVRPAESPENDQGFLDDAGTYLTRDEALVVVRANGQIEKETPIRGVLTSEDLW